MKNNKKSISAEEDTAKSYLMNIEKYKAMIDTKCKQYRELEKYSNLIGYKNLTNIFSANTGISRKTEDKAQKKVDLLIDIKADIYKYMLLKNNIINDIYRTEDNRYISILLKKYVELKTLEQTAVTIGYSYERTRHLHKEALKKIFEVIRTDKEKIKLTEKE